MECCKGEVLEEVIIVENTIYFKRGKHILIQCTQLVYPSISSLYFLSREKLVRGLRKFKEISYRKVGLWRKTTSSEVVIRGGIWILGKAFLCKWNWHCANEKGVFWRMVISSMHGEAKGG